jgi:hypothetical protein
LFPERLCLTVDGCRQLKRSPESELEKGGSALRWVALRDGTEEPSIDDEEALDRSIREFLKAANIEPTEAEVRQI